MVWRGDGNIGIGTTSPGYLLEVFSSTLGITNLATSAAEDAIAIGVDGEQDASIKFFDDDAESTQHFKLTFNAATQDIRFQSDTVDNILYMDDGGNVGIGTVTPQTNLHTVGTSGASGGALTDGIMTISTSTSGTDALQFGVVTNDYAWIQSVDPGNVFRDLILQPSSNSVGIGTTSPAETLHVKQTGEGNTLRIQDSDGTCNQDPDSGSLVTSCSSDEKLKENITDTESALDYFEGIKVRDYVVKASGDTQTGVIAQELMETHPELVHRIGGGKVDESEKDKNDIEIFDINKSGNGTGVYGVEAREGEDGELFVEQPNPWKLLKAIQELKEMFDSLVEGNYSVGSTGMIIDEDSVGSAVILVNETKVNVTFLEEYEVVPIITITPLEFIDGQYKVSDKSTKGFVIELQNVQSIEIGFDWHAFAKPAKKIINVTNKTEINITNQTGLNETLGIGINDTVTNGTIEDINGNLTDPQTFPSDEDSGNETADEDNETLGLPNEEVLELNKTIPGNESEDEINQTGEGVGNQTVVIVENSTDSYETIEEIEDNISTEEEIIPNEETSIQKELSQAPIGGSLITGGVIGINQEQGNSQGIFSRFFGMIFDLMDGEDE